MYSINGIGVERVMFQHLIYFSRGPLGELEHLKCSEVNRKPDSTQWERRGGVDEYASAFFDHIWPGHDDILTSESNRLIFVSNWTKTVNLAVWFKLTVTVMETTINGNKSNPLTVTTTVAKKNQKLKSHWNLVTFLRAVYRANEPSRHVRTDGQIENLTPPAMNERRTRHEKVQTQGLRPSLRHVHTNCLIAQYKQLLILISTL